MNCLVRFEGAYLEISSEALDEALPEELKAITSICEGIAKRLKQKNKTTKKG